VGGGGGEAKRKEEEVTSAIRRHIRGGGRGKKKKKGQEETQGSRQKTDTPTAVMGTKRELPQPTNKEERLTEEGIGAILYCRPRRVIRRQGEASEKKQSR